MKQYFFGVYYLKSAEKDFQKEREKYHTFLHTLLLTFLLSFLLPFLLLFLQKVPFLSLIRMTYRIQSMPFYSDNDKFFPWIPNIADKVVVTCCVDFFDDVLVTPFKMSSHWSLPTLLSFVKFSSSCLGSIGVKRIFGLGLQLLRKDFPGWWLDCFSDWFSLGM